MDEQRSRWREVYEPSQRALYLRVWRDHVAHQLARLNLVGPPGRRRLQDLAGVPPWRASALLAAAWLEAPERVARRREPAEASSDNRLVVSAVLHLVTAAHVPRGTIHAAAWNQVATSLDSSTLKQVHENPNSGWAEVALATGEFGVADPAVRRALAEMALAHGLAMGATEGDSGRRWLPKSVQNWFGVRGKAAKAPFQERRHAVVDAYFHDEYRELGSPSPVHLLLTYPDRDLVPPPDTRATPEAFERSCLLRDQQWYECFAEKLRGYQEVELVEEVLAARPPLAERYVSPPVSAAVPLIPPVVAVLVEWIDGLELPDGTVRRALAEAHVVLEAGGGGLEQLAALDVVQWLSRRDEPDPVGAICASVERVPATSRYGIIGRVRDAVVAAVVALDEGS